MRPHWVTGNTRKYSGELTYVTLHHHPNSSRYYDRIGKYVLLVYVRLAFSLILCKITMVFYYVFFFYFFFLFSSFLNIHFNRKILKLPFSYYLFINHIEMPLHKLRKFNTIHIFLDSINTSFFPCSFSRFSSMYSLFFYILLFFCAKFFFSFMETAYISKKFFLHNSNIIVCSSL